MHGTWTGRTSRLGAATAFALLLNTAACRRQTAPPPQPPPPPPPAKVEEPPPPPPPKCESSEENCIADESTRVEITDSGIAYAPPPGWVYVKASDHARASESSGAAVVGFAISEADDRDAILSSIEKLSGALSLKNVRLDRLKTRLKKPQQKLELDGGHIELWEINKRTQGGKAAELAEKGKGTALLALAHVATERVVVVLGFVVEPDEQGQAAHIMKSVQSLAVSQ